MSDGTFFVPLVFTAVMVVITLPLQIFWIVTLVEVVRIPEVQYRAAGVEKTTWVVIVGLVGFVGSVIWWATKRAEVKAAPAVPPPPVPGWYPDPDQPADHLRWWDGLAWTDHLTGLR